MNDTTYNYNYSGATGAYVGADAARESPREPGVFLTPAYATPEKPDTPADGYVMAYLRPDGTVPSDYQDGAWIPVIDLRGQYWSTETAQPVYLDDIGVQPLSRGLTDQEPVGNVCWGGDNWVPDIEKMTATAAGRRDTLLAQAGLRISPLADAVELGIATEAETALLASLKKFRVDVSRVTQQPNYPQDIVWPAWPDASTSQPA